MSNHETPLLKLAQIVEDLAYCVPSTSHWRIEKIRININNLIQEIEKETKPEPICVVDYKPKYKGL